MAVIEFENNEQEKKDNKIQQGDYVFCKGSDGALDFWGVYNSFYGKVISLDGAGIVIETKELYLGEKYRHWTIMKRIPCEKAHVVIKEIQD